MNTLNAEKPAQGRADPAQSSGQAQDHNSTAPARVEALAAEVFPQYDTYNSKAPTKFVSMDDLAFTLNIVGVRVGSKDTAPVLTPYKANAKTKSAAQQADYYAFVLDHDDDDKSADQIRATYDAWGMAYLAFTSSSHMQDKHGVTANRWKVLIPLAGACGADHYARVAAGAALVMSSDKVQARQAQVFFEPNKLTEDAPFEYIDETARPLVDANDESHSFIVACLSAHKATQERQTEQARKAPPKPRATLSGTDGGIIDKVCQQFDMAGELQSAGYVRKGKDLYLSPYSSTGTPGVRILRGDDGKERAYSHHGENDPLSNLNHDGHALDVFDIVCTLSYGGDVGRAVGALAPMADPDGNNQRRREFRQKQDAEETADDFEALSPEGGEPFSLAMFSLTGKAAAMKAQMLEDTFVLDGIALAGQMTALYAKPNAGKTLITLKLLMDGIKRGDVDASKVFYVNADDNYKGLVTKLELAERWGFHMLAPGHGGGDERFDSSAFVGYLSRMIADGTASGTIIILDTLKKFMDLMDKKAGTDFLKVARQFVSHNGTIIMLAHTNKHRDHDGQLVFAGTSDVVDDIDCAYMIDALEPDPGSETKTVVLKNFKSRGDVAETATYKYSTAKGQSYSNLLQSIGAVTDDEARHVLRLGIVQKRLEDNSDTIEAIQEALKAGALPKVDLEKAVTGVGISRRKFHKVLKDHTGSDWTEGHRWEVLKGEKNAQTYSALDGFTWGGWETWEVDPDPNAPIPF